MYKRKMKLSPIHISLIALAILVVIAVIVTFAVKKDEPKEPTTQSGIVYDDSAIEGGWETLSQEEIEQRLNDKVQAGIQHHAEPARARKGQHTPGRNRQCAQNAQRGIRREFPVYIGIRLPLFQCRRAQQKQQAHQHGKRDHRHGAPAGALRGAEEIARSPGNRRQIRQPK